jgi:hypothetical protein
MGINKGQISEKSLDCDYSDFLQISDRGNENNLKSRGFNKNIRGILNAYLAPFPLSPFSFSPFSPCVSCATRVRTIIHERLINALDLYVRSLARFSFAGESGSPRRSFPILTLIAMVNYAEILHAI